MRKLLKNKHAYRVTMAALTVTVILAVIVLNLFLMGLQRENNFFVDLTTEQIYTMSDRMATETDKVKGAITITFCDDVDNLLENDEMRPVYILAKNLEREQENVTVKTVSLVREPNAVDRYKTAATSEIGSDHVIVSCGNKFRLASADYFWALDEQGEELYGFQGEHKLASMMLSLTRVEAPVAYFSVGHGETYYDENDQSHADNARLLSFREILLDIGMDVRTVDLSDPAVSSVPADCALLIINGPTEDFTASVDRDSLFAVSEIEKLDRYLSARGSVLFLRNSEVSMDALPLLSQYLRQWGIAYHDDVVQDGMEKHSTFSAVYATEETASVAHSLYSMISDLSAAPRTMVSATSSMYCPWIGKNDMQITDSVQRYASPLFFSSDAARSYDRNGDVVTDGAVPISMVSQTAYFHKEAYYTYSYLMATGSQSLIEETFVGSNAYGNRDILRVALYFITRTDDYASSSLGSATDLNSEHYGGKVLESDDMVEKTTYVFRSPDGDRYLTTSKSVANNKSYTLIGTIEPLSAAEAVWISILVFLVALVFVPAVGIYICVRRKYL